MLWLSDVAGSSTDILTLQRQNREAVQADVHRIREEIASGKRHKVGSPEWMKEAGLVYNVKEERVDRLDEINAAANRALSGVDEAEDISDDEESLEDRYKPKGKDLFFMALEEYEPMKWVVPGMIAEGLGLLISPPKVGKSFLVLDLAVSVASGVDFCGDLEVNQRPVLYLALEDGDRRVVSRMKQLGKAVRPGQVEVHTEMEQEKVVGYVDEFVRTHPEALVIIDTLAMVMPDKKASVTQYQHDHRAITEYQSIAKRNPGSCVLIVHHTRKIKTDDWLDSTSGTQGINGAADFVMALTGRRGAGVAQLQVTGREVEDNSKTMKRDDNGFWLHDENAMEAPTPESDLPLKQREILEALEVRYEGLTPKELQEWLEWKNYNQVTNYLSRLMKSGHIRKSAGGRYVVNDDA